MSPIGLPAIGDTLNVGGVPTRILDMKQNHAIIVLGHRDHPVHAFATWILDPANGSLYSGHYWDNRAAAERDFSERL